MPILIVINNMKKKGQITVFIILGLIFLIFFLIILFTKSYRIEKIGTISSGELSPIKYYVDLCAKSTTSDALYLLGVQGGYTIPPEFYFQSTYAKIAYWYDKGEDTSPTIEEMEQELSSYVNIALPECIENLDAFRDMGFEFEFEFYKIIPARLGHMYSIAKEIVGKEIEDPDWIDMTYLVKQDIDSNIYPHDENTLIYSLLDNKSAIEYDSQFMFLFANVFKESEELSEEDE